MTGEKPEWADNDDEDLLTEPAPLPPSGKEDTVPMVELNEFAAANPPDREVEGEEGLQ